MAAPPDPWWKRRGFLVGAAVAALALGFWGLVIVPSLLVRPLSGNELDAMNVLHQVVEAQAKFQASRAVDADGDGTGEAGTLPELTGACGVRKGLRSGGGRDRDSSGFESMGAPIPATLLSPALTAVDGDGVSRKSGYCFLVYLPDSSEAGGWVHGTGPAARPGLSGGNGRVGVDASERRWCAYAWPVLRGESGTECYFVDESGVLRVSRNEVAKWSGPGNAPPAGAVAEDGDTWKVLP